MHIQFPTVTRVLRFRLKDKHARALREQAYWVNQVWNYCNDLSIKVWQRERRCLSGYDFAPYTKGLGNEGVPLHSQTVQAIAEEYALRRRQFKKTRLAWRVSKPESSKYSLGWIPFKASALRFKAGQVHFSGIGPLSLWDSYGLAKYTDRLGPGSFSEDSRGRWYLNLSVKVPVNLEADVPNTALGIDLGLKDAAITSNPDLQLDTGWYRALEQQLAVAQRARKKDRVRALHLKVRRRRQDAIHQFTTACVQAYGFIFVGNVSSSSQVRSGRAKSALDAGWGSLRTQLRYKCPEAGAVFVEVDEAYSTVTCSVCKSRTGPKGLEGLRIREWTCTECGTHHGRDANAARNILAVGRDRLEGGIPVLSRFSGQPVG